MRFIFVKCFVLIFFVSIEYIFAQNFQGDNYAVETIDKDCKSGFYLNKYSDVFINPFSPSGRDFEILFGVQDSSDIKIRIISAEDNESIVNFEMKIGRGSYILKWFEQNFKELKNAVYFCSFEAHQKNQMMVSDFNATKIIIIPK